MPVCSRCAAAVSLDSAFCNKCGAPVLVVDDSGDGLRLRLEQVDAEHSSRIDELETALADALERIEQLEEDHETTYKWIKYFESQLKAIPKTQLTSKDFWPRAFAVWGHAASAQLVFAIPIWIIVFLVAQGV